MNGCFARQGGILMGINGEPWKEMERKWRAMERNGEEIGRKWKENGKKSEEMASFI